MARFPFPETFLWGVATASYQIEGSPLADGAGPSIWHRFSHTPGTTARGDTGDVACDHYRRWREDVALMKELGVQAYRFSIAWPRLFPEGTGRVNEAGMRFYERLVDALKEAGIEPFITLYHWDLPGALQDKGGWANRDVVGYFADYADWCFQRLGDRVRYWITLNEPWVVAHLGYLTGVHAPGMRDLYASLRAAHHLLLAHAAAVEAFRAQHWPGGHIGITLNLGPQHPASEQEEDVEAAARWDDYLNRFYLDPLFRGSYPARVLARFEEAFPELQAEEMERIQTPIDFVGVNYYTRGIVAHNPDDPFLQARGVRREGAQYTEMGWEVYPEGLYEILHWLHTEYGGPALFITENGAAFADALTPQGTVEDEERLHYLRAHFLQAHRALQEGIDLRGYFVWSLMDNFEWAHGYTKRFGIVYVDFATQRRIIKKSGYWYRQVIAQNAVEVPDD